MPSLKTNWEILDQKVADVTALQQAVAGALHRQIVASLPTTDIDPNTIYMILSGTSATENVYNEFMYVNNAWELIGTSATDLTNYYTKAEVDGKLLLKASASDLTSHTGDTTIHVTTADKNRWNNQTYVFRYSSTALTASSTNANSLLDNTDNLKVGDKVIDSSGVLFSITAIDTQNSTFTIGNALIDLANDSDVVHKSGDETIGGVKTFTNNIPLRSFTAEYGVTSGNIQVSFSDKNNMLLSKIMQGCYLSGLSYLRFHIYGKDSNNQNVESSIDYSFWHDTTKAYFRSSTDNFIYLGTENNRWARVYATNYYYGSNNVEFSTKFVTTDTAQTISGAKTFSSNVNVYNSDNTANTPNLYLRSSKIEISSQGNTSGDQNLTYLDKNNTTYAYVKGAIQSSGSAVKIRTIAKDSSDNSVVNELQILAYTNGNKAIFPFNGVEPSSLSLPSDRSARIDISSYFTNTGTGNTNDYSVPANGFIFLNLLNAFAVTCYSIDGTNNVNYAQSYFRPVDGQIYILFPVRKNDVFRTLWTANGGTITVTSAYFIPCQGNV